MNYEREAFTKLELREEGGKPTIRGYAAVFNTLSLPLGGFREKIAPGAFAKSVTGDIRALADHDSSKVIGRTTAGTLALREDAHGLYAEISPPDTTVGRDLVESIRRKDIDGMSFGFTVPKGGDVWSGEGNQSIREVREANLLEVSVVAFPAYTETNVAVIVRHAPDIIPQLAERAAMMKMMDGKEHPASDFAHVGDPEDVSTWKLPIFDADHARNALARVNQVQGMSADEKKAAMSKIVAACKKFGIDVTEGKSLQDENAELREQLASLSKSLEDRNRRLEEQAAEIVRSRDEAAANVERMQRAKSQLNEAATALERAETSLKIAEAGNAVLVTATRQAIEVLGKPEGDVQIAEARKAIVQALKSVRSEAADLSRRIVLANLKN